jgi:hypothetical protein
MNSYLLDRSPKRPEVFCIQSLMNLVSHPTACSRSQSRYARLIEGFLSDLTSSCPTTKRTAGSG